MYIIPLSHRCAIPRRPYCDAIFIKNAVGSPKTVNKSWNLWGRCLTVRSWLAHCALTALSLHSHCDLCVPSLIIAALSLRSHHALRDLATTKATSLRPRYDLTTLSLRPPLRSVRLYCVRAATINTAGSTAGDTAMVKRRCTLWCCVEDRLYLYHLWPDRMSKSERTIHTV